MSAPMTNQSAYSLLATKLYIPQPRTHFVRRTRLTQRLNNSMSRPLTLVSAPAGFGKTSLIAEWIAQTQTPIAWLSLDENDNDPARFFAYLIAALETIQPSIGQTLLPLIQFQPTQMSTIETVLTMLLNQVASIAQPFALILDDYHLIQSQIIHNGVAFLVEHLPPQMHLVLITRADPPLPLARWRVKNRLGELRAIDLRFTQEEAIAFLNDVMALDITPDQITALETRTEGWIAGLQLAALSMQGRTDLQNFIDSFTGSNRLVLHYLIEEVLQRQPKPIQEFLMQTSILNRMTASLCESMTCCLDGQTTLEDLERANLFLIPLDDEGRWYRYHQLFADTLRASLQQWDATLLPELHCRASEWFEKQGQADDAVRHALAALDYDRAVRLIEKFQPILFTQNALSVLIRWIQELPPDILHAHPNLAMSGAWACLGMSQAEEAERLLMSIENAVGANADALMTEDAAHLNSAVRAALVEVMIARCTLPMAQSLLDFEKNVQRLQAVLPFLTDDAPQLYNPPANLRPVVFFNMALAYQIGGASVEASDAFSQAIILARERKNGPIISMSISHVAQLLMLQGQLHRAAETYREALDESSSFPSPIVGLAHRGLSAVLYEWNDLDHAEEELHQAIDLAKVWNNWETLVPGYTGLARVRAARGDSAGAVAAVDELADLVVKFRKIPMQPAVAMARAEISVRCGDGADAARWADASDLYVCDSIPYSREDEGLVLARLLIELKRAEAARQLIERLVASARAGNRQYHVIQGLTLQALAFNLLGQNDLALASLGEALTLAEAEGYIRAFWDCGEAICPLLEHLARTSRYARNLLNAMSKEGNRLSSAHPRLSTLLLEPLSEREFQVLRLIADGLSNQGIADRLVISIATVKKHIENAYAKLQVKSRTQAIARAKELGLIE